MTRWWFWMVWKQDRFDGPYTYYSAGPFEMTTEEAFSEHFKFRSQYLTPYIYRWVWVPRTEIWELDDRSDRELLAAA